MAINVLQYNQLARSIDAKKDQIAEQRRLRDSADSATGIFPALIQAQTDLILAYDSAIDSANNWTPAGGGLGQNISGKRSQFLAHPYCCCGWAAIPCFTDYTGVAGTTLCVWDTACADFYIGKCCQWTVPAGVTTVMFEVWGAGAASGAGTCCGFAPPGMPGAFAQTIINVQEGDVFTLCAGCAVQYCAYCTQGCVSQSNPSFVCSASVGPSGVCFCICARGGCHNACIEMEERTFVRCENVVCSTASTGLYRYWGTCMCICGSGSFLCGYDAGNCFMDWNLNKQPQWPSCRINACIRQTGGDVRVYQDGSGDYLVPSVYAGGCLNASTCGFYCYNGVPRWGCHEWCCFGSNICCGYTRRAACGCLCTPGQGASASWVCGGNTGIYGDYGRQGGIRVTYC